MILKNSIFLFLALLLMSCSKSDGPIEYGIETEATYTVTFKMNWNSTDFPKDYPAGAHFSKLIGWSHPSTTNLFKEGMTASEGIELMAETGAIEVLQAELEAKIANNEGLNFVLSQDGLTSGTGEFTVEVAVNAANPSVSLVSMLAPSPDWYVGALNVNLYDGSHFAASKTVTAKVYDAGTDSGTTYEAADLDTDPQGTISLFVADPLGDGTNLLKDIAKVTFTKN
ncbi:hypothetical protein EO244_05560 [Ancylomarina salipaludis]|uniref:Spondin domain-containing protein n=2 Tax=Ancylomarina salipaludis TaxID=2501299 RepID=A0A4Q1JNP6_9BACT|nr:hypothetical protein EO244_05560 [Ancylomarina salipaludis]